MKKQKEKEERFELFNEDCLLKLKSLPDESIDLVLSDFPYGINFMSKSWDSVEENFYFNVASALFPVMKSGSFLVSTFTPRQDMLWRLLRDLEKAGFELKHSGMYWLFHSGFPKSLDVAKNIDLKFFREKFEKENNRKPTKEEINEWKNSLKIIGNTANANRKDSPFKVSDGWNENSLEPNERFIVEPESFEAKQWFGWKSCSLKPAVECVVVAQKPKTEKTIVGQVLDNGCGAVNVEACRIPYASENDCASAIVGFDEKDKEKAVTHNWSEHKESWNNKEYFENLKPNSVGRFPANLLVEDDCLVGEVSGNKQQVIKNRDRGSSWREMEGLGGSIGSVSGIDQYGDVGSPNRFYSLSAWALKRNITLTEDSMFFDVAKPSKAEKNLGLEGMEEKVAFEYGSIKKSEGRHGENTLRKNFHATVKPVKLFCYLAELFCQPKGIVLDPFMGSGTTGVACAKMNKKFIGIEKNKEYFEIAKKRIKEANKQTKLGSD